MEEIVSEHPDVAECAVIGVHDDIKGEVPISFVVLKSNADVTPKQIEAELVRTIRAQIGAFGAPKSVHVVERLPKTRSGKSEFLFKRNLITKLTSVPSVLRRTLRDIMHGREYSVPGTIEDASVLTVLEHRFKPDTVAAKGG
jgi:propionyl-CoA synthetase